MLSGGSRNDIGQKPVHRILGLSTTLAKSIPNADSSWRDAGDNDPGQKRLGEWRNASESRSMCLLGKNVGHSHG